MGDVEQSAGMVMPGWGRKVGPGKAPWGLEVQAPLQKQNQEMLSTPLPDVLGVGEDPVTAQAHCSLAVQGRQGLGASWRSLPVGLTRRAGPTGASHAASLPLNTRPLAGQS